MLIELKIDNYALIDGLDVNFKHGLSIITGETGAGKSILLGALSMILGGKTDVNHLKNKEKNCIIEGTFFVKGLDSLLEANDIDISDELVIRRIINPLGKSRSFINDTPVNISVLKDISSRLIDIHSQHQNLLLSSSSFQLSVIDALSQSKEILGPYSILYKNYKSLEKNLSQLKENAAKHEENHDYILFQYNQLSEAALQIGELEELEEESSALSNVEVIKEGFSRLTQLLSGEDVSIENMLRESINTLSRLVKIYPSASELMERLNIVLVEIKDLATEAEQINEATQINPERLSVVENRLDTINNLFQKHRVSSLVDLIEIKNNLEKQVNDYDNSGEEISKLEKERELLFSQIKETAEKISLQRKKVIPEIESKITDVLKSLGIPNANFKVDIQIAENYSETGKDLVNFLFSANRDSLPQEISKVASGGEMSRLMLALKSLLVKSIQLPTIIFDEIDTGISGEVADKMGNIIKELSTNTQVINITHLPQIAAKGDNHYLVYKIDTDTSTYTDIMLLDENERVNEIAKMLSGATITDTALQHAKDLLKKNN